MKGRTGVTLLILMLLTACIKTEVIFEDKPRTGYVDIFPEDNNQKNQIFYWLYNPQNADKNAPLIIYINGGPGCASTRGSFTQTGPVQVLSYSEKNKTATRNPYGWNKKNYIVFIDQPIGVGFSTSTSDREPRNEQDLQEHFKRFMRGFMLRYPELKGTVLYMSSICYGGHYASELSNALIDLQEEQLFDFRGLFIMNPIINPKNYFKQILKYSLDRRELIGLSPAHEVFLQRVMNACEHLQDIGFNNPMHAFSTVSVCGKVKFAILHIARAINPKFNDYHLRQKKKVVFNNEFLKFLDDPEVLEHIGAVKKFSSCNFRWGYAYAEVDLMFDPSPYYARILDSGRKLWVVASEDDWETNYYHIEEDTSKFDWNGGEEWRQTELRECKYGLCKRVKNFNYVRVQDANHLVMLSHPDEAFELFYKFLDE